MPSLTDVELAIAAAQVGAEVVRGANALDAARVQKGPTDFATAADQESERAIMGYLDEHRPADSRSGEEFGFSGESSSARRWLVDPLCGTLNFAASTPLFCINVALTVEGSTVAAASADPVTGETFWTDGVDACLRNGDTDHPLSPSSSSMLVDVNCDGPTDRPFLGGQLVSDPALRSRFSPRVISTSLAVAWVAAGRRAAYITDGDLEGSVHFTAGIAICQAAGCVVTDLRGDPVHTGPGLLAAADWETHEVLLGIVSAHL